MRINIKTISGREIFGALNFELQAQLGQAKDGQLCFLAKFRDIIKDRRVQKRKTVFHEIGYATVSCTIEMAQRIKERLLANGLDASVVDKALQNQYQNNEQQTKH